MANIKKSKNERLIRKLFLKCEEKWKKIAFKRDGRECQVKKFFPEINIMHTDIFQVDHCFSRSDKNLYFNPRNATIVCSGCNLAKGFKNKSVDRAIDLIVAKREGQEYFDYMLKINQSGKPNPGWGKFWYYEEVLMKMEEYELMLFGEIE